MKEKERDRENEREREREGERERAREREGAREEEEEEGGGPSFTTCGLATGGTVSEELGYHIRQGRSTANSCFGCLATTYSAVLYTSFLFLAA